MVKLRRRILAISTVFVATFLLAGCADETPKPAGSELNMIGSDVTQSASMLVPAGIVYSYKLPPLCTTGDPVNILSIGPASPNDRIKVSYWAIQPNEFQVHPGVLATGDVLGARFPVVPGQETAPNAVVSGHCPADPKTDATTDILSQVLVTLERSENATASTAGFLVTYRTGSETRSLLMPYGMTLCLPNDTVDKRCRAL